MTINHDFQNCHTYHNCHVTIAVYQNWSQLPKLVKILTMDQNCHNYLQLFTILQSQLLFVTIGKFRIAIIGHYSNELSKLWLLNRILTIGQNCHNWSKSSQLLKIVTIGQYYHNCHNHNCHNHNCHNHNCLNHNWYNWSQLSHLFDQD